METATYKRTVDLMDESVFPLQSHYAQKDVNQTNQSNEEIAEFVISSMKDTLG